MAKTTNKDPAAQNPAPQDRAGGTAGGEAKAATATVALVSTLEGGHRRAGIRFGKAPVEVDLGALTDEQIEALRSDVHLRPVRSEPEGDAAEA